VIVTDIAMPRMRADELTMELRLREPGLPVILMTGSDAGQTPLIGRVIAKPVLDTQPL
jgi:CheY-like chemotaxis protein